MGPGHPVHVSETTDRTPDADAWDDLYREDDRVWSGEPNRVLVAEVADRTPGSALDVGCGEGADAVWLARRGWRVTALDVSRVALDRAEQHAHDAGVSAEITWVHAGLVEARLPPGGFDLVSAQYAVLLRTDGAVAEHVLVDLVAPGGTLLVVHHLVDAAHAHHHGHGHAHEDGGVHEGDHGPRFDPALYAMPADVAAELGPEWTVDVDEHRPRSVSGGRGAGHTTDVVLRARRG